MDPKDLILPIAVIFFVGVLAARLCGYMARQWLIVNAGWHETLGDRALRALFSIFMDIRPVRQYAQIRRARNEPTTLATVFWIGFVVMWLGLVGIFGAIAAS